MDSLIASGLVATIADRLVCFPISSLTRGGTVLGLTAPAAFLHRLKAATLLIAGIGI